MKDRFVVTLIVERECSEELDTACVADIMEEELRGGSGVKVVAMQVREHVPGHGGGAGLVHNQFIVQDEEVFRPLPGDGEQRRLNAPM